MREFDLENFLRESSVADLEWLDVNESDYRKLDNLPKQNLDTRPDLEALWAREGESPTNYLVPNVGTLPTPGINDPHTMGDMSQVHGPLRAQADEIRKVARLVMMQTTDPERIRGELVKRFGSVEALREHRDVLAEVLKERGLVGNLYVNAGDFPGCDQGGKNASYVRRYAKDAKFVQAKTACGDCCHAKKDAAGTNHCGVFHKEIQLEIPYTDELAAAVERSQAGKGKNVKTASGLDPQERIRQAYLAPNADKVSETYTGQGVSQVKTASVAPVEAKQQLISAGSLLKKKNAAVEAQPVIDFLHREMVKGLTHEELVRSLKLAFDAGHLIRTKDHWRPIFKESGLYGVVYTKQASFSDCHKGSDFLAKHNPGIRAIVAGDKCGSCIYSKASRCMLYGKSLVANKESILTSETVEAVLQEHKLAGRLNPWEVKTASDWGNNPAKALKAIHEATSGASKPATAEPRMGFMAGFHGNIVSDHVASGSTKREIVKQAREYLNEGLYGADLKEVLMARFEVRDLVAAQEDLRPILAEQGLQGVFYVDPSVYEDYGKGCDKAARLHRTRGVGYLKQGSKCSSCVHQTRLGYCSKINKELVDEPPYVDKAAQQREVLASGRASEVTYESLVNNATNTLAEYQMQHEMDVQVDSAPATVDASVYFGKGKVKL